MKLRSLRPADPVEARRRFAVSAFLVPTAVTVVGAALMALGCVPMATWGIHVLALVPALAIGILVARGAGRAPRFVALAAAVSLVPIGATLAAAGVDGVHRWLPLGPLQVHPSALLAPLVVAGGAYLAVAGRWAAAAALVVAVQALHLLQPDAGQAFAVALGVAAAALLAPGKRLPGLVVALLAGGGWIAARYPADPLEPVRHAEGILAIASGGILPFGLLGRLFVAVLILPALIGTLHAVAARDRGATAVAAGLFAYELGAVIAPALGVFPVPVLGFGASHVIGFALANGLLVAVVRGLPLPAAAAGRPSVAGPGIG